MTTIDPVRAKELAMAALNDQCQSGGNCEHFPFEMGGPYPCDLCDTRDALFGGRLVIMSGERARALEEVVAKSDAMVVEMRKDSAHGDFYDAAKDYRKAREALARIESEVST